MQIASLTPERQHLTRPFDWLLIAIERRRVKMQGTWLSFFLAVLISRRIMDARQRFYRLMERIRGGKFRPRKPAAPRKTPIQPAERPARKPPPKPADPMFKQFGWMLRLMPGTDSGHPHHALKELFEDPELAPILTAAPAAVWRELRPLCWMLGVRRPAILAPPPRPRPPRKPKRRKVRTSPKRPKPRAGWMGERLHPYTADWPEGIPAKLRPG
jgi:hypothetical protein